MGQPDFRTLFESAPGLYLVLTPDLRIVAASDAYLAATMTTRGDVLGKGLFEAFPDNPDDPAATGVGMRASVQRVLATGAPDAMPLQKHDIRRRQADGGGFEARYWSPLNSPVRDATGAIQYIIHRVEDMTRYVALEHRGSAERQASAALRARADSMESEVAARARELLTANEHLRLANEHVTQLRERLTELDRQRTQMFAQVGRDKDQRTNELAAQLQQSQEQLGIATAASGVGLWLWRSDLGHVTCDDNTRAMLGLSPLEQPSVPDFMLDVVHADDRAAVARALHECTELGARFSIRFRVQRRDGALAHIVGRGSVVRDAAGRPVGMTGALLDVTDEERTRGLFRIAVEASPNALLIVDGQGDIVLANAQAEIVFGYSRAELIGSTVDRLVPPSVQPQHAALRASYFAAPSQRKLGSGRDLAGIRKDGSEVPVEVALAPVELASGPGVLAAIVDITERKELQARLSQSERLAAVGELAAGVAHEINNPVNTMINCAQLVVDGDDMRTNCEVIMQEGARIATIVKDLLQFARDDRGRPQPTSLAEVVARTMRLLGESLKRHGIRCVVDVPVDLPPVFANPDQLQQVLLNLVINAKDALLHDASREDRCVTIAARPHGVGAVRCSVRDNGPGIDPELQARIFEPFVTTKRARGGTGLGLSVSRSIVESFSGTLAVDSVPGEFADFWFVLPEAATRADAEMDAAAT